MTFKAVEYLQDHPFIITDFPQSAEKLVGLNLKSYTTLTSKSKGLEVDFFVRALGLSVAPHVNLHGSPLDIHLVWRDGKDLWQEHLQALHAFVCLEFLKDGINAAREGNDPDPVKFFLHLTNVTKERFAAL